MKSIKCDGSGRETSCKGEIVEKYKLCAETMRFCERHSEENTRRREWDAKNVDKILSEL